MNGLNDLIDAVAAASLLGVDPSTLGHWRTTPGRLQPLPFHRVGGKVRYRRSDVLAFLAAGRVSPSAAPAAHVLRRATIVNTSVLHLNETVTGLLLHPNSSTQVELSDEAHTEVIRRSLRALAEANYLQADALVLELEGGAK